ncbi:MAG: hypothetical protein MSIBF_02890 [Candidatus Altiarchaeales archaeon IMC4]|nr:MAG: hypothetical protein MSIBF_02890 [Candidatus Altiarchaeales archaeon IMC4]
MKILLIYPPHSIESEQKGLKGFSPPLGLMYIGTILSNDGHDVKIVDMDTTDMSFESVIKLIGDENFEGIGISVFTRTRNIAYSIAKTIRADFPNIYISLGGPHCCLLPDDAMIGCADSVVSGEAELIINKVFEEKLRGIINAPLPKNLDEIPFPDQELIDVDNYGYLEGLKFASRVTSISSSRGCPYNCSFCTRIKTMKSFRYRSAKNVFKEIKKLENEGFNGIWIIDDNFNALPNRVIELCDMIKKEKIRMDFGFQGRFIDTPKMWNKLARSGFCQMFGGIEHIKPEIVGYFNKYYNPNKWKDNVEIAVKQITDSNISLGGSIILGSPQESRDDASELINWCYDIGVDVINTNELELVYGSQLWFDAVINGFFPKERLHVRITELQEKEYLDEMFRLAWELSIKNWGKILKKIIRTKNDKFTPIITAIRWKENEPDYFFNKGHDGYGYGKRSEIGKIISPTFQNEP